VNDGLIDFYFKNETSRLFDNFNKLEIEYFKALNRRISNRIITINLKDIREHEFSILREVVSWINA
jgi:hypothetical protein